MGTLPSPRNQGCRNPGGMGGYIPPNNLTVSPPIVEYGLHLASPQKCDSGVHLSVGIHLNLGKKVFLVWLRPFFWSSPEFGEKSAPFLVKSYFFLGLHLFCSPEQNRGRGSSPPMLKIGQNWGKIAIIPPNAQQRSAPLLRTACFSIPKTYELTVLEKLLWIFNFFSILLQF